MTGTAVQRPSLQPDTPVFRSTMIHRPNVLNTSAALVHARIDDARIFRRASLFHEGRMAVKKENMSSVEIHEIKE